MRDPREQLFRCDFVCDSLHVYVHVRAWDAAEALTAFVAELQADGVAVPGEIHVTPMRGGAAVKAPFRPGGGGARASDQAEG